MSKANVTKMLWPRRFICLITLMYLIILVVEITESLKGVPRIYNCQTNPNLSASKKIPNSVTIRYTSGWYGDTTVMKKYPNIIIENYTWSWSLVKSIDNKDVPIKFEPSWIYKPGYVKIPPYTLPPGYYKFSPKAIPNSPGLAHLGAIKCLLHIKSLPPVAVIVKGKHIKVHPHRSIHMSAKGSYDKNTKEPTTDKLTYTWTCTQKPPQTYCATKPLSRSREFTIPAESVLDGDRLEVTLRVTANEHVKGYFTSYTIATQIIDVFDERPKRTTSTTTTSTTTTTAAPDLPISKSGRLEIVCGKNCPPLAPNPNYNRQTFLIAKCLLSCENIADGDYEWTIQTRNKDFQINYARDTLYGRHSRKFVLKKNVLKPGEYTVKLQFKDSKADEARITLPFIGTPSVQSCDTDPDVGSSIKTMFKLVCNQSDPNEKNFYELYAINKEDASSVQLVVHGYYPDIQRKKFMLPASDLYKYVVKVSSGGGASKDLIVDPLVQLRAEENVEELIYSLRYLYKGFRPSKSVMSELMSKNEQTRNHALQKIRTIVNSVVDSKVKNEKLNEFAEDLKFRMVTDMMHASPRSLDEITHMTESISKLMAHNTSQESDPLLHKFATTICSLMMLKHKELLLKDEYPMIFEEQTEKLFSTVTKCLESNIKPNYKILKPIDLNTTTDPPSLNYPIVIENYPDYVDYPEEYYQNLDYLIESTHNIINASAIAAKAIALTTAIGQEFVKMSASKSATVVYKDNGRYLYKKSIRSNDITVIAPPDFKDDDHPYDILVTTWTMDLMWWNPNHTQIVTNIVSLEFWHSTCKQRITSFSKPVEIFFNINNKAGDKYESVEETITGQKINIRRLSIPRKQTLYISFASNESASFSVVITSFKYPTSEDFGKDGVVSIQDGGFLSFRNSEDYAVWCYVAVKVEAVEKSISYQFGFAEIFCIRWMQFNSTWVPACETGIFGNASVVHCRCHNLSVLAGYMQPIKSVRQEVLLPDIELKLQANYIIFITVALTLLIYCCILIPFPTEKTKEIYYLADNNMSHRYAYMIVVQTGSRGNSGTSSNVTIRLTGEHGSSKAHVLNYPDPTRKLMQRHSNDIFILATENYLGRLKMVELWYDSLGYQPDWYCKEITVVDMRRNFAWNFPVNKRLDLTKGNSYIAVKPEDKNNEVKSCLLKWSWTVSNHTWFLCEFEDNYSHLKKMTVIVSTFLTVYLTVLLYYGVPSLKLKDQFDSPSFIFNGNIVTAAVLCSLPAFIIHLTIAWSLRYSKTQFPKYDIEGTKSFKITLICWVCLGVVIVFCTTFLVVVGFWEPHNRSLCWLCSCMLGIPLSVVVYEGLFLFVQQFFCKFNTLINARKRSAKIKVAIDQQRKFLHTHFGGNLLRPYFEHLYKPMQNDAIYRKKMVVEFRRFVVNELYDLLIFGVYIIMLYIVLLANKDILVLRCSTVMEDVVKGLHLRSVGFHKMESTQMIYTFINNTLIPSIQPKHWYANYVVSDPALIIDMSDKYIGVVRLREQRIKRDTCRVPKILQFLNTTCRPDLSGGAIDKTTFGYAWGQFSEYLLHDRMLDLWQYAPNSKTGTLSTFGEFSAYPGGGYVSFLGRTLHNSYANFRKMVEKSWIDSKTRSIFVEFLTYTANCNVFSSVQLLFEVSATGYSFKTIEITSAKMLFVNKQLAGMTIVFFGLFATWVILLSLRQSLGFLTQIRTFYKDVWHLIDSAILLMSLACIGLFITRMKIIGIDLKALETAKKNDFLNYFYLFYLEKFMNVLAAILVCIATVRLWKFLRFAVLFRILERTLSISAKPLLTLASVFFLLVCTFAMTLVIISGNYHEQINSVVRCTRLLVTMAFKANEIEMKNYAGHALPAIILTIYTIIQLAIIFLFMVTILMGYSEAQIEFSGKMSSYNLKNYVQEQLHYIPKYIKYKYVRLWGGQVEDNGKVEPKSDKFIYARSHAVSLSKMFAMKFMVMSLIRNMKQSVRTKNALTNYDVQLIFAICRYFLIKPQHENMEVFFKGRVKDQRMKLINEKRISEVAKVVNMLLMQEQYSYSSTKRSGKLQSEKCVKIIKKTKTVIRRCELQLKLMLYKLDTVDINKMKKL